MLTKNSFDYDKNASINLSEADNSGCKMTSNGSCKLMFDVGFSLNCVANHCLDN